MTVHRTPRRAAAALAGLVATALALVGCASMPTSGDVMQGEVRVDTPVDVGFNVQGPSPGADPQQIVQDFVSVAQFGPASANTFAVAREYLTPVAWSQWNHSAPVLVLTEYPDWTVEEYDDASATTSVHGEALVAASIDETGAYTELPEPSAVDLSYDLSRGTDGEWRITGLEDGLLVLANFLAEAFHRTTLYYPTPDRRWWVPDVRWYPEQSWRTAATQEILAGPPEPLQQSVVSVVPEGTTLAIDSVSVDDRGVIDVSVTSAISAAPAEDRSLLVAQLEETLREGDGRSVELSDGNNPLAVQASDAPSRPVTIGDALAVVDRGDEGPQLRRVSGTELVELTEPPVTAGLDLTAVGAGPGDLPVVVRDGDDRLLRVAADAEPVQLLRGEGVLPPSVDRFGTVWTAVDGELWVVWEAGASSRLDVEWLVDRRVRSVRVSPEGARVVLVVQGPEGREVWAAAIQRDAEDVPTGLSTPWRIGAPVPSVSAADWSDETTVVLLGRAPDGSQVLSLAGIGGLAGTADAGARELVTPGEPVHVASAVGASPMLVLDTGGVLQTRQSSALWPSVSGDVVAVAYPG
ncbi:LpqB family beta-propeller domain-containing protein [Isoptericola sp. b408]|uniref:LpqB family beta-propeller domain-containing protein n=1 Tax=Isoptericola sp. b408 TaxID=3064653 RepID=UPI0027141C6F|nr:LpqB family beta-propeller domain-containing protein [Isoptericola sp. b408]MDO8151497.1 LpqB family beta-propeller domain-containing protein [Isoptericola sp. b408]